MGIFDDLCDAALKHLKILNCQCLQLIQDVAIFGLSSCGIFRVERPKGVLHSEVNGTSDTATIVMESIIAYPMINTPCAGTHTLMV